MPEIRLINLVRSGPNGPMARQPSGEWEDVFLRQGSLDGACGLYSIFMALLICGVAERTEFEPGAGDGRRAGARLMQRIRKKFSALAHEGAYPDELRDLLAESFRSKVEWEFFPAAGTVIRDFVVEHISQSHPVILGLSFQGGRHFVVVVGIEYGVAEVGEVQPRCLMILDPNGSEPQMAAWNGVIGAVPGRGRYPYPWWGTQMNVALEEAIAIWPR